MISMDVKLMEIENYVIHYSKDAPCVAIFDAMCLCHYKSCSFEMVFL